MLVLSVGLNASAAETEDDHLWQVRLAGGLAVPIRQQDPRTHVYPGVGVAADFYIYADFGLRWGMTIEYDRYRFDTEAVRNVIGQRFFKDETLSHVRGMATLRWDTVAPNNIDPFVFIGVGGGKENSTLHSKNCSPKEITGFVFAAGAGLDVSLSRYLRLGGEARLASLLYAPLSESCTLAIDPTDPVVGPPREFLPLRLFVTLTVRD